MLHQFRIWVSHIVAFGADELLFSFHNQIWKNYSISWRFNDTLFHVSSNHTWWLEDFQKVLGNSFSVHDVELMTFSPVLLEGEWTKGLFIRSEFFQHKCVFLFILIHSNSFFLSFFDKIRTYCFKIMNDTVTHLLQGSWRVIFIRSTFSFHVVMRQEVTFFNS